MELIGLIYILTGGCLFSFLLGFCNCSWQNPPEIRFHLSHETLGSNILGKFSNYEDDHLKLLDDRSDQEQLLIGGRDAIFNLSSNDLKISSILNWTAPSINREMCQFKGQKESDCHNFIQVFHGPIKTSEIFTNLITQEKNEKNAANDTVSDSPERLIEEEEDEGGWLICGTNAFKPTCRVYNKKFSELVGEVSGIGYVPFNPLHMSTSVLNDGTVYTATVGDFGGSDSLIYKYPQRTEQRDLRHLSSPSFVSSMNYKDDILFFFRELAVEHTNCGKVVFSRVARICGNDSGSRKHKDRFSTFLKARLNCSVPGEFPFYFDHLQATSSIFKDAISGEDMIYAVFTTPENSIRASALCSFRLTDITKVFDGQFKGQSTFDSNWLPVAEADVPVPRPGSCSTNPASSDAISDAFHKSHPLMDEAVQGKLTLVFPSPSDTFTAIEVQNDDSFHIIYIGTSTGKILKAVVDLSQIISKPVPSKATLKLIEDVDEITKVNSEIESITALNASFISSSWQVDQKEESIKILRLLNGTNLLVGSEEELWLLPRDFCSLYTSCSSCIQLRDPHCFWDLNSEQCLPAGKLNSVGSFDLRQDIQQGDSQFCPPDIEVSSVPTTTTTSTTMAESTGGSGGSSECCSCSSLPPPPPSFPPSLSTENRIPELEGIFRGAGSELNEDTENEIIQIPATFPKDYESSHVKSGGVIGSGSIVVATIGSALLSLLIGFCIGFGGSRWISRKRTNKTGGATNAQLAVNLAEQAQRLTSKPIDFVLNVTNGGTGIGSGGIAKNNFANSDLNTMEKTVKKIYL